MREFDIDVCLDCHLAHHSGETATGEEWSLLAPGETVTDNTMCRLCFETDDDCDHNQDPFSWTRCDGCGSTLGGERFTYCLWPAK